MKKNLTPTNAQIEALQKAVEKRNEDCKHWAFVDVLSPVKYIDQITSTMFLMIYEKGTREYLNVSLAGVVTGCKVETYTPASLDSLK